jgi:environmental stress-induced protein Ves
MPWANGGGVSYEIARFPAEGDFDWRISLADVAQSGPFSILPGIDRVLVLLSGESVTLRPDSGDGWESGQAAQSDDVVTLRELEPFAFAGEVPYTCTLNTGPAQDFNVMTRRGMCTATVVMLETGAHEIDATSDVHFVVCARGSVTVDGQLLETREAARIEGREIVTVDGVAIQVGIFARR